MPRVADRPRFYTYHHPAPRCEHIDCNEITREKKPFCPEHVEVADYVKTLCDKLEVVETEIKAVGEHGYEAVDLDGLVVNEILAGILLAKQATWIRVVKDYCPFFIGVDIETKDSYVERLHREKLVVLGRNKRGIRTVRLSDRGRAATRGRIAL